MAQYEGQQFFSERELIAMKNDINEFRIERFRCPFCGVILHRNTWENHMRRQHMRIMGHGDTIGKLIRDIMKQFNCNFRIATCIAKDFLRN